MSASTEHNEAIIRAVSQLMQGEMVRLSRIGTLTSMHHPATRSSATWMPPYCSVAFTHTDKYPEMEPPTPLDFLSRHVREKLALNGKADVPGFGVFVHTGDGGIGFTAHGALSEAMNHAWSHLEARDVPPPVVPEAASDVLPPVGDDAPIHEEPEQPVVEAPEPEPEPEPEPGPGPEPPVVPESPPIPPIPPVPAAPVPPASSPAADRKAEASRTSRTPRTSRPQRSPWLAVALIVIPVAAAFIFWFSTRDTPAENEQVATAIPPDTASVIGAQSDTSSVPGVAPETAPDSVPDTTPVVPTDTTPSDTPIVGTDELQRGMDGYTLIVTSSVSQEAARDLMGRFDHLSLPLGVLVYETDGDVLYRVGVGRWSTAALADSARQSLSSSLPDGTWVRRLN